MKTHLTLSLFVILLIIAACANPPSKPPIAVSTSVTIQVVSGNLQIGKSDTNLPEPILLQVVDNKHEPVPECPVALRIIEGNGTLADTLLISDNNGLLNFSWKIGPNYNTLEATPLSENYHGQPAYIYASAENATGISEVRTMNSLAFENGFYTLQLYGDFTERWKNRNDWMVGNVGAATERNLLSSHNCSLFAAIGTSKPSFYGRNTDSPECNIMVTRYHAPNGYATISFSRIFEAAYDNFEDLMALPLSERRRLFDMGQSMIDGMNEKGVVVAVADYTRKSYQMTNTKDIVFTLYMMRKILDYAGNVQEAIDIVKNCNPWDGNNTVFHSQFLIADPENSVWVYYNNNQFHFEPNTKPYQSAGHRYSETFTRLSQYNGNISWQAGMATLQFVSVNSQTSNMPTIYSNIYDLRELKVYTVLNREYDRVFELDLFGNQ